MDLYFKRYFIAFFVLFSFSLGPNVGYASLLWKMEKNGLENFLLGTIHLSDQNILNLPHHVKLVVEGTDALVIEVIVDSITQDQIEDRMFMRSGTLKQQIGEILYSRLIEILSEKGYLGSIIIDIKPWAAAILVSAPPSTNAPVLDVHLQQLFNRSNRRVYALESLNEQLDVFDSMSSRDQLTFLRLSLENANTIKHQLEDLKSLYLKNDLDAIFNYSMEDWQGTACYDTGNIFSTIITQRNELMFSRLATHLQAGNRLIAVGALHLPGESGLLNMLRQSGYELTPVMP